MSDILWQEAIDDFLNHVGANLAPRSVEFLGAHLRQLRIYAECRELTLQQYNGRHWRSFVADRVKSVSPRTVYGDFQCARRFFRFCRRVRHIPADPLKDYVGKCPRRKDPGFIPEPPDLKIVMDAVHAKHDPAANPRARFIRSDLNEGFAARDHAIICMLIATGARIHEILALKYANLDRERRTVLLIKTKGNKERTVPFEPDLLEHIEPWLKKRDRLEREARGEEERAVAARREMERRLAEKSLTPEQKRSAEEACRPRFVIDDTLFLTRYGDHMRPDAFSKQFAEYVEFSGVKRFTLHKLRHFTISMLGHIDLPAASNIAGHESISTTEIYTHTKMAHMRTLIDKAQPLGAVFVNKRTEARRNNRPTVF